MSPAVQTKDLPGFDAPTTWSGPLLEVIDLKTYFDTPRGIVKAVDGVSFTVEQGKTIGIVGESGSGKTVLSRSVMNLLPKRAAIPAGGQILFQGKDLRKVSNKEMREIWGKEIAMVFQDPMTSLNPVVKIGRQITESLRHHLDLNKREANETAVSLLRSVGLPAPERRLNEYPHQLSGGMRQRVTTAIALACGPRLLIADEPTTALDVTVQKQILDLLQTQQRDRHMGMMLITHDLGVVANRADDIVVMYAGQVVERAATKTLFKSMRHPYTEALLRSIPRIENRSHTLLEAIPGRPPDLANLPQGCRFAPRCRYAQDRCVTENPDLFLAEQPGHEYRCFFPVGTDAGKDALAHNSAVGHTATGTPVSIHGSAAEAELVV
ncbi:MAG: Oligopeptide transport ATP-binding protein OppD [uncultured Acidimicrobiales bacterium]|uniref:Oligopeptide transport ATP-binding protein OppD n=1 Tax=uncultured Acidimicrobiales bacterium TaxID=310071 RepID=A0A6J4HXZ2_9ACTN|nr:MAG: Oligopeptide transport ATP-binding protein OppD [uncultured Acidimicrobiales bacterium]